MAQNAENETQIRELIENWAKAVRHRDIDAILTFHSRNLLMCDAPDPFHSVGFVEYRKTWNLFFKYTKMGVVDIRELNIIADEKVALAYAKMQCSDKSNGGHFIPLEFRLTIGLRKVKGQWTILHENLLYLQHKTNEILNRKTIFTLWDTAKNCRHLPHEIILKTHKILDTLRFNKSF